MSNSSSQIYQIKVFLNRIRPMIWRRILVSGDTTLSDLHDILQMVMGWENDHLHEFKIDGKIYDHSDDWEFIDLGWEDSLWDDSLSEHKFTLSQLITREGQRFTYTYDFGDRWEHTLLVEKILPPQEGFRYPVCLKGARACPPEDIGGVWGYQYFLEAIRDPNHVDHEHYLEWYGGDFDPEAFNLEEVNNLLRRIVTLKNAHGKVPPSVDEDNLLKVQFELDSAWANMLPENERRITEELPLRRDMVTLLHYLRNNKVKGSKNTGNFPLKVVREICAQFVDPPQLEPKEGDIPFHMRSESDVQPLVFRHMLAATGGLISGGEGRLWKLTPLGERFLAADPAAQVFFLAAVWWTRTNWAIAAPSSFEFGYFPLGFSKLVLEELLQMPAAQPLPFKPFAGRLLEFIYGLSAASAGDEADLFDYAARLPIQFAVIEPLVHLGILHTDNDWTFQLPFRIVDIETFQVTPFGRGLLQAIQVLIESGAA